MSHGLEVLRPKSDKAFPIPCDEWSMLKGKIKKITSEPWLFHTLGSLLLGASVSTFLAILLNTFRLPEQQRTLDISWAVFAITFICGTICLFFANGVRSVHRERATDVVAQMELIEKRYEPSAPNDRA